MDLRTENPATAEQFVEFCAGYGMTLPVREDPENFGVVMDANGRDVVTVDVNGERPDEDVGGIVAALIVAINTCGGFRAERAQ